jgi:predicted phage terminase large subunit-like protein
MGDLAVFDALLRSDPYAFARKCFHTIAPGKPFVPAWHLQAIAYQLQRIERGEITRLIVNLPPRSGKSICVSVAYVAWLLGLDPTIRVTCVSYSNDLAAELHRQFRMIIHSEWYKRVFPLTDLSKDTEVEAVTTLGGGRYATSIEGTLTGRGADLIIIDDPHKAEEAQSARALAQVWEWYSGTLVSRLDNPRTGKIIVTMQRLHSQDLSGRLLASEGWTLLKLPARAASDQRIPLCNGRVHDWHRDDPLECERVGLEVLEKIKRDIGSSKFNAQYLQEPVPIEGNLIRVDWLKRYDRAPEKQMGDLIVQSWDIATGIGDHNDYSVCATFLKRKDDYYLLDVFRDRLMFPDLQHKVRSHAWQFAADIVLIEKVGFGIVLLQDLQNRRPHSSLQPIGIPPRGTKLERLVAGSVKIEAGHLYLPMDALWLADFLDEFLGFPNTRHDDQVDAVSQFLQWASSRWLSWYELPSTPSLPVYGSD